MSMEMHVLFRGPLPSKAALARTIEELGFPLTITSKGPLDEQSGFMPMRHGREDTGVELDVFDGRDTVEELAGEDIAAGLDRVVSLRWGGDEQEMLCAMCTAAALAKLTTGLVLEEAEGQIMSASEAAQFARDHVEHVEQTLRRQNAVRNTRPTDFKHYLAPLLKARSDLVLLEKHRLLLIRPVRHILRGVAFVPCLDKFSCDVVRFVAPLYSGHEVGEPLSGQIHSHVWYVWQPYFVPLLMDVLAEDVFADLGALTTLSDLAQRGSSPLGHILAGEKDKATDLIQTLEPRRSMNAERGFLERDPADLCREFHEREARTAKAFGLGDNWQPSPFPIELPPAERDRVAEPVFLPRPWPEQRAPVLEDAPDRCGTVRFSIQMLNRNDRILLVAPLLREEAEVRYRANESYVLGTRMAGELLVILHWGGYGDRNNPERPSVSLGHRDLKVELYSPLYFARASVSGFRCEPGFMSIGSLSVHSRGRSHSLWQSSMRGNEGDVLIHDDRHAQRIVIRRELTDEDRAILTMPVPEFDAFEDLVGRVTTWSRRMGFGSIV